jgi:hypothetical protein
MQARDRHEPAAGRRPPPCPSAPTAMNACLHLPGHAAAARRRPPTRFAPADAAAGALRP